ncbi:MAG: RpoL/Rpb11 RNA polymerase subunit family protein [Candidatus Nanoarchaeia archaeon]|nr:RpoL/Rpb11 RNA polymerase subunit family protein [Candidatus Nanoarchaeia archaeon]MDD5053812.1 RpoL/Rpb11 RNA polymerase subunit family protein [Candidatus Nanoarchaeia archaeon]MDD5499478.1 RpoL/Rpb11 RNA polymerase subunit family protein [Candidatus Nanoarchaeia archaeon]
MDLSIVTDEKNFIELKFDGDAHTFLNIIKRKLVENKEVSFVGYNKPHPLVKDSSFSLRTLKADPKKLFRQAIDELIAELKELSL